MKTPQVSIAPHTGELNVDIEQMDSEEQIEAKHALKKLINSSGWSLLRGVVDQQVQLKNMSLLQPLPNRDAVLKCEHLKGQVSGAIGVTDLAYDLIEQLESLIQEIDDED